MPTSAARSLADQLRSWPDERLTALLEARPDLATPAPTDSAQLAVRVSTRPSVLRALDGLDTLELTVLEASLHAEPATAGRLREVVLAAPSSVDAAVDRLLHLALVWGTSADLRPVSVLAELLGSPPGPPLAEVPGRLEDTGDQARALLEHLDAQQADGTTGTTTDPIRELRDRRLLVLLDDGRTLRLPWTVRVVLRSGRSTREPVDVPPDLATSERDPTLVDRAAAGAAFELVRRTELLLDQWGSRPPGVLRAGGLGVRDLRSAATLLGLDGAETGLLVETAYAAGLLGPGATDDVDPAWLPTAAYDAWLDEPVAQRWAALADAWLATPRQAGLVGSRDQADRPVNALAPDLERRWLPQTRRETLETLADAPGPLAAGTGLPSLLARLRWHRPRRPAARDHAVGATLDEAAFLGVTGLSGLATYARALLSHDLEEVATGLADLLPEPVDHVLLQADLTAVAPGPLESELARRLGLVGDVESRGGATVYRFGTASVRRAFDAGWSAAEVKELLSASSRTPVPQALDFLVDDVARTFGTTRVGAVSAYLRSDDETALAELTQGAAAAGLRLRRIAPTVVVTDVTLDVLLPRLREIGHAPVVEAADGSVRVARLDVFRSRARTARHHDGADVARSAARAVAVAAAIRSGDRVAAARPAGSSASRPGDLLALLRQAAEERRDVVIDYVDNHGRRAERLVRPDRVEGGRLVAHDDREGDVRSFAVPRISTARLT